MPVRYASIITDDDGREVVSAIGAFEGAAPQARAGRFEPVAPGVLIGMVRGGPVDAVGGFGFPLGSLGIDGRAVDIARADLKGRPEAGMAKADAAQQNSEVALADAATAGTATSAAAKPAAAKSARKAAKPARAKSRKGKSARAKSRKAKAPKPRQAKPARVANTASSAGIGGKTGPGEAAVHG
ncbi:hypothetical protein [Mesorhizobium sp. M00.F.Ca.ET.216.01.1.1]|uniref:hypothetical protein n=1 Tax=Mesorhizobium sp. M00.F.Ca.ET.216.01.1.1 TaxID=2500528 RepID=UPI000FDAE906|nr:hypothetical protein [Mesorhizobium sp. M00.F.Ca.ET.216.01.1.1]TGQ28726.1 hypothetical protein EN859_034260 [Mesorhizobium sp. M00.F.Ca.ET.216.01.1.1]